MGMKFTLSLLLAASVVMAAGLPINQIRGDYIEARSADVYTGPCFGNAEAGLVGDLAVMGWRIQNGAWQGVKLDGLSVVGVVKASGTLGDGYHGIYPVKSVLIVDDRANAEQRLALKAFAQRMAGDLLQDIVRIEYQPISLTFENGNMHSMQGTLKAGNLAAVQTRAINQFDHICSNEEVWYGPLTKVDHAMPAYALAHKYSGKGLGTVWSAPEKRSAFVGSFNYND
jgi:hypothetical protein